MLGFSHDAASGGVATEGEHMLSYLETLERLTSLRDGLRESINTGADDREAKFIVKTTELTLTKLLGELVTPDPLTIGVSVVFVDPTQCPNPWHASAPARMRIACSECPTVN